MEAVGFIGADACYLVSLLFYLSSYFGRKNLAQKGFYLLISGLAFHTVCIIGRWWVAEHPPLYSLYEILIFFAWAIVFLSLVTGFYKAGRIFTALSALVILGIASFLPSIILPLPTELNHKLFPIHVSTCLLGYAAFSISFICAVIYLTRRNKPGSDKQTPIQLYDLVSYRAIVLGLLLFSAGIILGSVWAKDAWGSYWSWDPKETASLITWFIYSLWLFIRLVFPWNGTRSAWLAVIGLFSVLFTWFAINYFLPGLHSYK